MIVALIPARGGSKGVKNKNLRRISGSSLVQIATKFALDNKSIDRVIVSTDSIEIASEFLVASKKSEFLGLAEGQSMFVEERLTLHKRRSVHATDKSLTVEAVFDVIENQELGLKDWILLLQPTSPFRSEKELEKMLQFTREKNSDSCVSAKIFDSPHPDKAFQLGEDLRISLANIEKLSRPRQELGLYYVFDGSYYLATCDSIINHKSFISPRTVIFVREGIRTLNIDNAEDMEIALLVSESNFFKLEINPAG